MADRTMLVLTLDPPFEISWAEQEAIAHHCLWSQDENPGLLNWLESVPGGQVLIHIAGRPIKPDVLALDMEHLTVVRRVSPTPAMPGPRGAAVVEADGEYDHLLEAVDCDALLGDDGLEFTVQLTRAEAIYKVRQRSAVSPLQVQNALNVYADVMKPRFDGEPFVHLTVGKRALPIRVRLTAY